MPQLDFLTSINSDILIIISLVIILSVMAMRWGTGRACVVALTLPVAAYVFDLFTRGFITAQINAQLDTPVLHAIVFLMVAVVIYILIHRMFRYYAGEQDHLLFALLTGIATTCLILSVWINTSLLQALWHFGPVVAVFFAPGYAFWWCIGALTVLAYVRS